MRTEVGLRVAVMDGVTTTQGTPGAGVVNGAVLATAILRAQLRNVEQPLEVCVNAANTFLYEKFKHLPGRDRPQVALVACDVSSGGLELLQAGDCSAWSKQDLTWQELFTSTLLIPEAQARHQLAVKATYSGDKARALLGEAELYNEVANWNTTPIGLFKELKFNTLKVTKWEQVVLATDGALLNEAACTDIDSWLEGLEEYEVAYAKEARRHKLRDDVALIELSNLGFALEG